ncbi:uncharacterized protein EAE98_010110 [Botrytis deweyae]|uniref:Uncharacterized protein n=1 Tax=Botrytis deweyae TaxID=2478750 RepID=A0ABQ7I9U1_9HELO|nr:uncharacterized protein EAE98_010110 [Botrytis deweyae]KAF7917694.1 hypothetical protein EAE98_010110 [Botrytis deweyae]
MTGSGNIARSPIDDNSQNQVTSLSGSSAPLYEVWSGPWRRTMYMDIPNPGSGFEDGCSLDLKFYEIVTIRAEKIESVSRNFWNNGILHTESNNISSSCTSVLAIRKLLESQYHFLACSSMSDSKYWTPLEMNPATFAHTSHSIQDLKTASGDMLFCAFLHAYTAISETANRWKKMLECFGQFIGDKLAFLAPEYHDKLLSDDEGLSRSKNYLYVEGVPYEYITEYFADQTTVRARNERNYDRRRVGGTSTTSKLETKQEEGTYFRDGNVKLLTSMSILFPALLFRMLVTYQSIWSIDTSFDYLNLLLAVNILAASIYFLGYNVDQLLFIFQNAYNKFIKNTLQAMKKDEDAKWATREHELIKYLELSEGAQKPPH